MYNVVNSIITDRKMYRCIFKVSFYFRGSLYEINVLLTLFLQIEVSILPILKSLSSIFAFSSSFSLVGSPAFYETSMNCLYKSSILAA